MRFLFTIIISLWGLNFLGAQANPPTQEGSALLGSSISFEIQAVTNVTIKSKDDGIIKEESAIDSDTRSLSFYLGEGYGAGTYRISVEVYPDFTFQPEYIDFTLEYMTSEVTAEDDFVRVLLDNNNVVLNPLANDVSSTGNIKLAAIGHTQYGSSTINNDNTITYQRGADAPNQDYIVYTAVDSLGSEDIGTIYISFESEEVASYKEENRYVYVGKQEVLLLDATGYTLDYTGGASLDMVQDWAYRYSSDVVGRDTVSFFNGDIRRDFYIETYNKEINTNTIVVDDEVFTAINETITFDVLANDKTQQLAIVSHSPELTSLGNGMFEFTPEAQHNGYNVFTYSVSDGVNVETGKIEVIVSNFNPINSSTYEFVVEKNGEFLLDYNIPLQNYYFTVENAPLFGDLTVLDGSQYFNTCDTVNGLKGIVYKPYADFVGNDFMELNYCPTAGGNCTLVKVALDVVTASDDCSCLDDCVWKGDANADGIVDNKDVLTIGRYLGYTLPARTDMSAQWTGEHATDKGITTKLAKDIKHADCNGDGVITYEDIDVVRDYIGKSHTLNSSINLGEESAPLYFVTTIEEYEGYDEYKFDVYLGSSANPIVDIEGIAFTLNVAAEGLDSSSVTMNNKMDCFFTASSPYFAGFFQPQAGKIEASIIKTNRVSSTGFGELTSFNTIIEDEAIGIRPTTRSNHSYIEISLSDISVTDSHGNHFSLEGYTEVIERSPNSAADTKVQEMSIYPNPANNVINISGVDVSYVSLLNALGQRVLESDQSTLDVQNLPKGIYYVKVVGKDDVVREVQKVILR